MARAIRSTHLRGWRFHGSDDENTEDGYFSMVNGYDSWEIRQLLDNHTPDAQDFFVIVEDTHAHSTHPSAQKADLLYKERIPYTHFHDTPLAFLESTVQQKGFNAFNTEYRILRAVRSCNNPKRIR